MVSLATPFASGLLASALGLLGEFPVVPERQLQQRSKQLPFTLVAGQSFVDDLKGGQDRVAFSHVLSLSEGVTTTLSKGTIAV